MLSDKLNDLIEKEFTPSEGNVFHYTKREGYSEICRSKHLRINSHRFLNEKDSMNQELKVATSLIMDHLKANHTLNTQVTPFRGFIKRGIIFYSLSLCQIRSPLMATRYGNYCFEFNSQIFRQFQKTSRTSFFGKVIYNPEEQHRIIQEFFGIFERWENTDPRPLETLFTYLSIIIPLLKPKELSHENECRIIQAEIFEREILRTALVSKKFAFKLREIINIYKTDQQEVE